MNKFLKLFLISIFIATPVIAVAPESSDYPSVFLIQENSLIAVSEPCYKSPYDLEIEILRQEIVRRESGGDSGICNLEFGCGAGAGLCGFIPNTWNSTLARMKNDNIEMPSYCWQKVSLPISKDHPIFISECHLIVCEWLLRTDGIKHWEPYSGPYFAEQYGYY